DKFMLDGNSGDTTRPASILQGVSPITASTLTPVDQAMRSDVGAIVASVSAVSQESEIVLIGNPRQASAYRLQYGVDAPFAMFASSALAAGPVIAVATNCLAHASGGMEITLADQGMVHMETSPVAPFGAGTTVSLFQGDLIGIRVSLDVNCAVIS